MKPQSGNVLFLILISVALFAALSYAVTSSNRGGGNNANTESASARAAALLNHFAAVDSAVQRMRLIDNVKDYEINFNSAPNYIGPNFNANCTVPKCSIFLPAGGGVANDTLSAYHTNNATLARRVLYVNVPEVGTDAPDILYGITGVKMDICFEINKKINITGPIYNSATNSGNADINIYQQPAPIGEIPNLGNNFPNIPATAAAEKTFCTCPYATLAACNTTAPNNYPQVWHVVVAR